MAPSLADVLAGQRTGLVLSAGFFGFYAHAGLLAALEDHGVRPAAVSGSSAGAMIAALHGAGVSANGMARILRGVRREAFWDPAGVTDLLRRRGDLPAPGLLRGRKFRRLMASHLPVQRFESCRVPVYMEATNLTRGSLDLLDRGELAPAVVASSAYPGLFQPVKLGGCHYWDGGMVNKIPVACMLDEVDAIVIHWLQSRSLQRPARAGPGLGRLLSSLTRGLAIARRENSRLQARLALERGLPVYVISPRGLPRAGPLSLHRGPVALEEARSQAAVALAAQASSWRLDEDLTALV